MSLIDGRRIIFVNTILNRATPPQVDSFFSLNLVRRASSAPITELLSGYNRPSYIPVHPDQWSSCPTNTHPS